MPTRGRAAASREWHIGHKHISEKFETRSVGRLEQDFYSDKGVRVRRLTSLSGARRVAHETRLHGPPRLRRLRVSTARPDSPITCRSTSITSPGRPSRSNGQLRALGRVPAVAERVVYLCLSRPQFGQLRAARHAAVCSNGVWLLNLAVAVDKLNDARRAESLLAFAGVWLFYTAFTSSASVAAHHVLMTRVERGDRKVG
jgi:hypothetical protein